MGTDIRVSGRPLFSKACANLARTPATIRPRQRKIRFSPGFPLIFSTACNHYSHSANVRPTSITLPSAVAARFQNRALPAKPCRGGKAAPPVALCLLASCCHGSLLAQSHLPYLPAISDASVAFNPAARKPAASPPTAPVHTDGGRRQRALRARRRRPIIGASNGVPEIFQKKRSSFSAHRR